MSDRCVYDMFMVLFLTLPGLFFLEETLKINSFLIYIFFSLATCYHWKQRGKVTSFCIGYICFLFVCLFSSIYLFIFGCIGSSLLLAGFL